MWATLETERTALLVVHNTTTLNRLLDLIDVLAGDRRVQCLATSELEDPFADRLPGEVEAVGLAAIPWQQAARADVDLILSTSHHGRLADLHGPLVLLPHGAGFGKYSPGTSTGARTVFGLAPEWLLHDGHPLAAALGVPHPDQIGVLAEQVPAAVTGAVVIGDRTFDRILASLPCRRRYRAALGVPDGGRLVVISSTWGACGTLGTWPQLPGRLLAELLTDDVRVALVAHPNIWAWHGPYQLRAWLTDAVDRGLLLVPPLQGWQAALVAADVVVGDHGSVTVYGAALGRPTLLAAFPSDDVVPGTAAALLGRSASRLDPGRGLSEQLGACMQGWTPEDSAAIAELVTSVPGEASARLAALFSGLLRLDVPLTPAPARPYGLPIPTGNDGRLAAPLPVPGGDVPCSPGSTRSPLGDPDTVSRTPGP
ncbi:MAG TPA: hypothetical protein VMT69_08070 [Kineosporiaceae bacterium]|nr:hypothetical protein [Kineosporiaceae bacterium]